MLYEDVRSRLYILKSKPFVCKDYQWTSNKYSFIVADILKQSNLYGQKINQ
jgi:hypothetical protein